MKDVAPAQRRELNAGRLETRTLVEILVIDFVALMHATIPHLPPVAMNRLREAENTGPNSDKQGKRLGITERMAIGGEILDQHARKQMSGLSRHKSDTVRGWAAYAIARREGRSLAQRLQSIRPLADDPHSGVREWAWIAVRPAIIEEPLGAIELLKSWTTDPSPNIRRFASEATRPRGVWCAHIELLKRDPAPGLPILEPLRADRSRYVQNSVANWFNDAGKTNSRFVQEVTRRWLKTSPAQSTTYICKRAMRSIA